MVLYFIMSWFVIWFLFHGLMGVFKCLFNVDFRILTETVGHPGILLFFFYEYNVFYKLGSLEICDSAHISTKPVICYSGYISLHFLDDTFTRSAIFFLQCRCGFIKQYSGMKKTGGYKILVKAAVRTFCLFVAISVWKPGIAAACGIIFLAWAVSMCVSQSGVCMCQSVTAPVWMFTVLRNHRL